MSVMSAIPARQQTDPINQAQRLMDLLVAGYIVCLPVQLNVSDTFHLAPSDLFLAAALILFALGVVPLRIVPGTWSIWHGGMVLSFAVATMIALLHNGFVTAGALVNKDVGLLTLLASYGLIASQAYTRLRISRLMRLLVISVSVLNLICIASFIITRTTGIILPGLDPRVMRLSGFLIDPNAYGGLLVLTMSLHILTYFSERPLLPAVLGLAATVTMAIGIVLTYSRSCWIGLGAVFLISAILRPKTGVYLLAIGAAAVFILFSLMGADYNKEFATLSNRPDQVENRLGILRTALPMFEESPAFGIGLGVYNEREGIIIHNTPIWILTECGVFGFLIFLGFAFWFLTRGISAFLVADQADKAVILALITACAAMVGLSMGIEALYQRHWWFVLSLLASSTVIAKRDATQTMTKERRQRLCR